MASVVRGANAVGFCRDSGLAADVVGGRLDSGRGTEAARHRARGSRGDGGNRLMNGPRLPLPPKQTLLLILLPMLGTFAGLRLYLHLVRVQHVYPGGYLVHHLFMGVLIVIPAAFVLAFEVRRR